jgi:SAM-dependent methyltransferase
MYVRDRAGIEAARILELVQLEGARVLDVGCGEGRLTLLAAHSAARVYAFDPSAESIAAARAALPPDQRERVHFVVHDAETFDAADERSTWPCAGGRCDASQLRASCTPCATFTPRWSRVASPSIRSRSRPARP